MQQLLTNLSWLYKWYHNMHSHGQPVSHGQGWGDGWVPPPGWQVGGITQGQLSSHVLKYTSATYSENISLPQAGNSGLRVAAGKNHTTVCI